MSDAVVRHRRHPSLGSVAGSLAQAALFVLMVAPSAVLWAVLVHVLLFRR
ncbi:hypothetical protein [Lapillicoccus jejuensis]|uniref:Uncharacterized protein n=1 Tax=Lapillicoccus jejuensis TaxID=402171 RepID=A0A542E3U4_9MICO|nr:hypothetical protein [Lapillicoccus jejuensis]TQJ09924.1 hypothetical protein FB458_3040 [Lapillicoccus jejuensis]